MAHLSDLILPFTDGDSNYLPSAAEIQQDYKTSDDYDQSQKALSSFANHMMKLRDKEAEKGESEKRRYFVTVPAVTENACCVNICFYVINNSLNV